jgi:hypothetical protein
LNCKKAGVGAGVDVVESSSSWAAELVKCRYIKDIFRGSGRVAAKSKAAAEKIISLLVRL